jgi:hypothetical protein
MQAACIRHDRSGRRRDRALMGSLSGACESAGVRRLWRMSGALALLLVVAGVVLLWSWHAYKQWPWSSDPSPLHWCGRDYSPQGAQTRATIVRHESGTFHKAGDLPGRLNHGEVWTTDPGNGCGAVVPVGFWVKVSDDRFEEMVLEGSP